MRVLSLRVFYIVAFLILAFFMATCISKVSPHGNVYADDVVVGLSSNDGGDKFEVTDSTIPTPLSLMRIFSDGKITFGIDTIPSYAPNVKYLFNGGITRLQSDPSGSPTTSTVLALANDNTTNGNSVQFSFVTVDDAGNLNVGSLLRGVFIDHTDGNEITGLAFWTQDGGALAEKMRIMGNGNVGIGTTGPGFKLEVNGSAGKPGGGSWSDSSDRRLKKNITAIDNALEKISRLRGVNFEWIHPEEHGNSGVRQGFIAQEVEEVFPDFVTEIDSQGMNKELTGDGKTKCMTLPFDFDAYLVEAIKELKAENDKLRKRISRMEKKLNQM